MADTKTVKKVFTLFDYDKEEKWLEKMHSEGWKVERVNLTRYRFERCEPEKTVYRIDFCEAPEEEKENYLAMFREYGWEYVYEINSFVCFRRSAEGISKKELEIFSDKQSRTDMMQRIIRRKLLPLLTIFLCCCVPNILRIFPLGSDVNTVKILLAAGWTLITLVYLSVFIRCYSGYKRNKKRIDNG
jgi:hypothetical protein